MWYKGIYEMPPSDKPADSIIEDDTELDRWYQRWQRDVARKSGNKGDSRYRLFDNEDEIPTFRG